MLEINNTYIVGWKTSTRGSLIIVEGDKVTINDAGIVPLHTWPMVERPTLWNAIRTWWMNRGTVYTRYEYHDEQLKLDE
jgi:hypothetical protein